MNRARNALALSLFCFLAASLAWASLNPSALSDEAKRYQADIDVLASDAMEGRGLDTEGIHKAAAWIEQRLETIGLVPAFGETYRQPFDVKMGVTRKKGNRIEGLADDDWTPLGFSSSGEFSGPLVFAGYGISAPPVGYDDLAGLDLHGKVVLMLRYEPQERDDNSPFAGRKPSRWSSLRYKVLKARERGAVAVAFVTGPMQDEGKNRIPALVNDGPQSPAGIPVFQVRTSVAQKWLAPAGIDLATFQKDVDRDLRPRSKDVAGSTVQGRIALEATYARTENLAGIIPGKGSLADQIVVIGAHYDHLGWGGRASMRPNEHAIHNGADDNASGVIAAIHAGRLLESRLKSSSDHRTVAIVLFSGEEVGLAGSAWFVDHAPFDVHRVVAMINLDMVGRLRNDKLIAMGSESAPQWDPALASLAREEDLQIATGGDGYGPSDQTSFYAKRIPVVHFFTGTHEQYHSPDDDPNLINSSGAAKVVDLTARLGEEIALGRLTPTYVRADTAPAMEGDSRGYGAYLGTVPDFTAMEATEGGVLLSDVRRGGPADLAGIKGGDRIVEMAGTKIANLYDMTFALQDHKPGETIDVVIVRDDKSLTLRATLGDRANRGRPAKPATPAKEQAKRGEQAPSKPAPAPPSPHAGPMPSPVRTGGLDPFYEGRPGKDFVIKAGKPYDRPVEGEKHFKDIRQLTFGGENAEAYFSPDGKKLIYQATLERGGCDQQYILDLATGETKMVSSGKGRTTCGYFDYPEADRIIYSSTEASGAECPPPPDRSRGYVWAVYDSYDIYEANPDGSNAKRLTTTSGYDAEATWCHRGGKIVFTSDRDGDLDLYEMDEAGNVKRLTDTPGYDGGAFFSADCSQITWRASRPKGEKLDEYKSLLNEGLVRPSDMEIFVMNADGSNQRQITNTEGANFCPYFYPDGKRIIYSSNAETGDPREFELFAVDTDGGNKERITYAEGFDGFPMFSPDGQFIVWASNRADPASHETNLFIARWVK